MLIPRPETELLVEEALKIAACSDNVIKRILDVGAGSGAIGLALASSLPGVRIFAVDISPEALKVASGNAEKLDLGDRVSFVAGNLTEPFSGTFDMIVSNPPYIAESDLAVLPDDVKCFEPMRALAGGDEGLFFHQALIHAGDKRLRSGGWLLMEIGAGQAGRVSELFDASRMYDRQRFITDYAGIDRVAVARRC